MTTTEMNLEPTMRTSDFKEEFAAANGLNPTLLTVIYCQKVWVFF